MKVRQFLRKLSAAGCSIDESRGKGGHMVVRYKGRWTTVPHHGSSDLTPTFMRLVCKQIGLDPKEVL